MEETVTAKARIEFIDYVLETKCSAFAGDIIRIVHFLIEEWGISNEEISLYWDDERAAYHW